MLKASSAAQNCVSSPYYTAGAQAAGGLGGLIATTAMVSNRKAGQSYLLRCVQLKREMMARCPDAWEECKRRFNITDSFGE
jgi:hypothetical protein